MMPESNALRRRAIRTAFAALALPALLGSPRLQAQNGSDVRILPKPGGGWVLERNGKPFSVLGAGGSAGLAKLKEAGGNSIRTWGADNLGPLLDEAQKLGLTVCVGIWFGHEEQGFHYNDPQKVAEQQERVRQTVLRYRNHPAVLMWALGNEMEGYGKGDNPTIWHAIHDAAHLVKQLDPHHPTMTVVAEIGGEKVKAINALCPEIDIIGINSYGGGPSLAQRYRAAGGVKPYIITEFGPPGTWETGKNAWGAALEKTSTQKAEDYRRTYEGAVRNQPLCMGSYAFTWGSKQEATATWYGMFLPDGSKLAAVDAMSELWTGKPVAHPCPVIKSLKVEGEDQVPPGSPVKAALDAANPQGGALTVRWVLQKDPMVDALGGETQAAPPIYPDAIRASSSAAVELKMPEAKGAYRLFAYVHSASDINGAAVANIPLRVREKEAKGSASENTAAPAPVKLPFVLLGNSSKSPFVPSGWMGNAKDIRQEEKSQVQPRPVRNPAWKSIIFPEGSGAALSGKALPGIGAISRAE